MIDQWSGESFCVPNHDCVTVCIHQDLMKAFNDIESEASRADEPYTSITEIFEGALVDFLRDAGRLPKPYV